MTSAVQAALTIDTTSKMDKFKEMLSRREDQMRGSDHKRRAVAN